MEKNKKEDLLREQAEQRRVLQEATDSLNKARESADAIRGKNKGWSMPSFRIGRNSPPEAPIEIKVELKDTLDGAREAYAAAYRAFMAERKSRAGVLTRGYRAIAGGEVKDSEIPAGLKALEEQYERMAAKRGQEMYDAKKAELFADRSLTSVEINAELKRYKANEIFTEVVVGEHIKLNSLKVENLPPKERGATTKIIGRGLDWYMKQGRWTKVAISTTLSVAIIALVSGGSVAAAGGLAHYAGMRGVRAVAGSVVGQNVAKLSGWLLDKKSPAARKKAEKELAEMFAEEGFDTSGKHTKKKLAKILEQERRAKRDTLITKGMITLAAGIGTSALMGNLSHHGGSVEQSAIDEHTAGGSSAGLRAKLGWKSTDSTLTPTEAELKTRLFGAEVKPINFESNLPSSEAPLGATAAEAAQAAPGGAIDPQAFRKAKATLDSLMNQKGVNIQGVPAGAGATAAGLQPGTGIDTKAIQEAKATLDSLLHPKGEVIIGTQTGTGATVAGLQPGNGITEKEIKDAQALLNSLQNPKPFVMPEVHVVGAAQVAPGSGVDSDALKIEKAKLDSMFKAQGVTEVPSTTAGAGTAAPLFKPAVPGAAVDSTAIKAEIAKLDSIMKAQGGVAVPPGTSATVAGLTQTPPAGTIDTQMIAAEKAKLEALLHPKEFAMPGSDSARLAQAPGNSPMGALLKAEQAKLEALQHPQSVTVAPGTATGAGVAATVQPGSGVGAGVTQVAPGGSEIITVNHDAIIGKGEGIEHALRRQIDHDGELAKALGFKGDVSDAKALHEFSGRMAHEQAVEKGYFGKDGQEVRIREAGKVAYQFKVGADGKVEILELNADGTQIEAHSSGSAFETDLDKQEYGYKKPDGTTPSQAEVEAHAKAVEAFDGKPAESKFGLGMKAMKRALGIPENSVRKFDPTSLLDQHVDHATSAGVESASDAAALGNTGEASPKNWVSAYGKDNAPGTITGNSGVKEYGIAHAYGSSDVDAGRTANIFDHDKDFLTHNPFKLSREMFDQVDKLYSKNIQHLFPSHNAWAAIEDKPAISITSVELPNVSEKDLPLWSFIAKMQEVLGDKFKPLEATPFRGAETIAEFIKRGMQAAASTPNGIDNLNLLNLGI